MRAAQLDLLRWQPPEVTRRFEPTRVRAHGLRERVARAVAAALADAAKRGLSRDGVAARMTEYLGAPLTKNMLDAYASVAREDHTLSVTRFAALLHATGDQRLLEMLASEMGWAVIERRYLPLIELAAVHDRQDELRRVADHLRRQARATGVL